MSPQFIQLKISKIRCHQSMVVAIPHLRSSQCLKLNRNCFNYAYFSWSGKICRLPPGAPKMAPQSSAPVAAPVVFFQIKPLAPPSQRNQSVAYIATGEKSSKMDEDDKTVSNDAQGMLFCLKQCVLMQYFYAVFYCVWLD